MNGVTITREQMEKSFQYLSTIIYNRDWCEEHGERERYENYLSEFCGILSVYCNLGILNEWYRWRAEHPV